MPILEELRRMSPERFLAIYQGLEVQGYGPLDREVAAELKFRPVGIVKLPMATRAKRARAILESKNAVELAYEVLGAHLIKHHKALVTGFLDATGVKHEDGMIEDVDVEKPDGAKVAAAVKDLDAKFPAEEVTLYLALAAEQWASVKPIFELWEKRAGAAVKKT